jgi:hypothetical protein
MSPRRIRAKDREVHRNWPNGLKLGLGIFLRNQHVSRAMPGNLGNGSSIEYTGRFFKYCIIHTVCAENLGILE